MENLQIDEETVMKRILFKEKANIKALAQKCLELEKIDYGKISPAQRDEIFTELVKEIAFLESDTEKQGMLHEMFEVDMNYHVTRQRKLESEIKEIVMKNQALKCELEKEKNQRVNVLEYENYAKLINLLPRPLDTQARIQQTQEEYGKIIELIRNKNTILAEIEQSSKEMIENLNSLIDKSESYSRTSFN